MTVSSGWLRWRDISARATPRPVPVRTTLSVLAALLSAFSAPGIMLGLFLTRTPRSGCKHPYLTGGETEAQRRREMAKARVQLGSSRASRETCHLCTCLRVTQGGGVTDLAQSEGHLPNAGFLPAASSSSGTGSSLLCSGGHSWLWNYFSELPAAVLCRNEAVTTATAQAGGEHRGPSSVCPS